MPGATENARVALEEEVPIINTSLGKTDWIANRASGYGGNVLATVTNAQHAKAAVEGGAVALMVTGYEAAAHGSEVGSLVLIPSLVQQFPDIPIVAAGGFAHGSQLAAALSLGADGIAMGTRLAMSRESSLPSSVQSTILESSETDTLYGENFDGIPARVLQSPRSLRLMKRRPWFPVVLWRALEASRTFSIPLYKILAGLWAQPDKIYAVAQFGAATKTLQEATIHGNLQDGVQFVGQCQGLIDDVLPVDQILQRILHEAQQASRQTASYFEPHYDNEDYRNSTSSQRHAM